MKFTRGTIVKAVLYFLAVISVASRSALSEGVDVENIQVINVTPGVILESYASRDVRCARVPISGLSRLKLSHYSSARKITLIPSDEIPERSYKKIQICSHRNSSVGLCQCENDDWENIQDGMWSSVISPYEDIYIDVKFVNNLSGSANVNVKIEFQRWRLYCLLIGLIVLLLAPTVSSWVPFYYSSSMAIGIFLVVIILLFQGMKLLPLGRKNALYSTICGLAVGAGTFLLNRLSAFVSSILVNFGISEEMLNPVLLLLWVIIVLVGAGFGYWLVRKFVVAEDGSVDVGVAQFAKWALRVIGVTFIFLSTLDIPLALVLLVCLTGIYCCLTSMSWDWIGDFIAYCGSINPLARRSSPKVNIFNRAEFLRRSGTVQPRGSGRRITNSPFNGDGSSSYSRAGASSSAISRDHYSTFHRTPNRKRYSKEEWRSFTQESTKHAIAGLVSSPEFTDWIVKNADRIQLNTDNSSDESVESGSDSTDEHVAQSTTVGGLPRRW